MFKQKTAGFRHVHQTDRPHWNIPIHVPFYPYYWVMILQTKCEIKSYAILRSKRCDQTFKRWGSLWLVIGPHDPASAPKKEDLPFCSAQSWSQDRDGRLEPESELAAMRNKEGLLSKHQGLFSTGIGRWRQPLRHVISQGHRKSWITHLQFLEALKRKFKGTSKSATDDFV